MRLIIDTLAALMVVGVLAGVVMYNQNAGDERARNEMAREETRRFQREISRQAALNTIENRDRGYPNTIDPKWFQGNLPANSLLGPEHPWVEIASSGQRDLSHPLDRVATDEDAASFWYNPHQGTIRARVSSEVSDARALELYNFINDCDLRILFGEE